MYFKVLLKAKQYKCFLNLEHLKKYLVSVLTDLPLAELKSGSDYHNHNLTLPSFINYERINSLIFHVSTCVYFLTCNIRILQG